MDARDLTRALNGRWRGHSGMALCPAHENTRTPALSIGQGDDGRLLLHCFAGCTFERVMDALRDAGLIGKGCADRGPFMALPAKRRPQKRDGESKAACALALWREAVPVGGTLAETYLREARHITAPLPDTLRFHPSCWHPAAGRSCPALLGLIEGAEGFGLHRTFLRPDGLAKAELDPAKMMIGHAAGGAVRLAGGAGPLVVAEGIETALSLASGLVKERGAVWAALSTSGMKALRLPEKVGRLVVASDGDAPGREAADELAFRASLSGWSVSILPAPEGRDWNDILALKGKHK